MLLCHELLVLFVQNRAEERLAGEAVPSSSTATPGRQRKRIGDIHEIGDIDDLTVLQLKEVLATSYVDYRGCVEKWELQERVRRLWKDTVENKRRGKNILTFLKFSILNIVKMANISHFTVLAL